MHKLLLVLVLSGVLGQNNPDLSEDNIAVFDFEDYDAEYLDFQKLSDEFFDPPIAYLTNLLSCSFHFFLSLALCRHYTSSYVFLNYLFLTKLSRNIDILNMWNFVVFCGNFVVILWHFVVNCGILW